MRTKKEYREALRQIRVFCRWADDAIRQGDWDEVEIHLGSIEGHAGLYRERLERADSRLSDNTD